MTLEKESGTHPLLVDGCPLKLECHRTKVQRTTVRVFSVVSSGWSSRISVHATSALPKKRKSSVLFALSSFVSQLDRFDIPAYRESDASDEPDVCALISPPVAIPLWLPGTPSGTFGCISGFYLKTRSLKAASGSVSCTRRAELERARACIPKIFPCHSLRPQFPRS